MTPPMRPLAERERPGLSVTLPLRVGVLVCRGCLRSLAWDDEGTMKAAGRWPWHRWQECDEWDQKTPAIVALCVPCSDRLIEPHPRMYHRLDRMAPFPGAVPLCTDCPHNSGWHCDLAKINGGPGVYLNQRGSTYMHILCSPRRNSGFRWTHQEYPRGCETPDRSFTRGSPRTVVT